MNHGILKPKSDMVHRATDFTAMRIKIASPDEILKNSYGEITKPETINYRTRKPEKDGLFSERIFGPTKDYECYCGKYKRIRYKGLICDKCGVEITRSVVRRERMGHIALAAPVAHIWFLRGVPSRIGLFLDIHMPQLERVIYYAGYIVTMVDEEEKKKVLEDLEREYQSKLKEMSKKKAPERSAGRLRLEEALHRVKEEVGRIQLYRVLDEEEYYRLSLRYGGMFNAETGAESIRRILTEIDLKKLSREIKAQLRLCGTPVGARKILRRLKLVHSFMKAGIRPEWMFITVLPVLPPDLRPMVQLDGGRFASSDLNDLYRRVINRNNRLKRLMELKAPDVIVRNEKRMLQEAVDALIDNSARRGRSAQSSLGSQRRPLKSLADMLKGKQGRFRQNLLGKRVDYSGRSVIVIGPELSLNECGMPKRTALEIFKPFVMRELLDRNIVHNMKGASRLVEDAPPEVWGILEEVIRGKYVLLNRAPTLHRLSVQAFRPVLTEGLALQIPAMVCQAFNADFDGDQMAVHLPLSEEAQAEAEQLMIPGRNLLKPATGDPIVVPEQDIVLGLYWLTAEDRKNDDSSLKRVYSSPSEVLIAYDNKFVGLRDSIRVRIEVDVKRKKRLEIIETTVGRIIFNGILPEGFPFVNRRLDKKALRELVLQIVCRYGTQIANDVLDRMKDHGFSYAMLSGLSWGMDDLTVPREKAKILTDALKEVAVISEQYQDGLLTNDERRKKVIAVWFRANEEVGKLVQKNLDPDGPIYAIIDSGSRGSWAQPSQMAGMKGLVINPSGEIIELPIKSSYKEGFNVLEYFISTHGARKGSTDTALRTASAGYLTRRLVDVAQDVVVREADCKTNDCAIVRKRDLDGAGETLARRIASRTATEPVRVGRKVIVERGEIIDLEAAKKIEEAGVEEVKIRSVLRCRTRFGVCQKCYGFDLGYNEPIKIGEAVGIVAAQAIGEPGTQLTMRTFHTGGVASVVDITQGLPRVEEIFEARPPRGKAPIAERDGKVMNISEQEKTRTIKIRHSARPEGKKSSLKRSARSEVVEYVVPSGVAIWVKEGDEVKRGTQLAEGNLDLKELLRISGVEAVEQYILREVKKIYHNAGEAINDKHIEIIVKQMLSRVRIKDRGDSPFMTDDIVDKSRFLAENAKIRAARGKPCRAVQLVMGITKIALSTESFLSAASFQETARVLVSAACDGRIDELRGLKENVIIGKLIPAGTGYRGPLARTPASREPVKSEPKLKKTEE